MLRIVALALAAASLATADLPKFDQVSNGYKEVVSTGSGRKTTASWPSCPGVGNGSNTLLRPRKIVAPFSPVCKDLKCWCTGSATVIV